MSTPSTAGQSSAASMPVSTDAKAQVRLKSLPQSAQNKYEHLRRVDRRARALADGLYEETARVCDVRGDAQRELGHFDRLHQREAAFTYQENPQTGDRMRQQVDALAQQGRPGVEDLFHGREVRWPTEQFSAACHGANPSVLVTTVRNASALAVWAHRDAVVFALDAEIDAAGHDKDALSAVDQAVRIAECEHALLNLQREAEAIIERLEGDGVMVRRVCTDPSCCSGSSAPGNKHLPVRRLPGHSAADEHVASPLRR